MTAGEVLAAVDALRPNQYSAAQKLEWLRQLDGKLRTELLAAFDAEPPALPARYTAETVLPAPFPCDWELYTSWLFAQIDLHNAEIVKYNQSMALFAAAWRQLGDCLVRTRMPAGRGGWRL